MRINHNRKNDEVIQGHGFITGIPAVYESGEVVLSLITAINNEDFKIAKNYINTDMSFEGVLGSREGSDAYLKDLEKMRLKYKVKKVFVHGNDVCLWYDFIISNVSVFGCGLYHLDGGKISSLKVLFDPRPLLDSYK